LPNSNAGRITEALKAEMADDPEVLLLENPPALFSPGSVVVTPGDPFLTPATTGSLGLVLERWEVLVVVAMLDRAIGIGQMRDYSLRVRSAVSRAGGRWLSASGPRRTQSDEAKALVLSSNIVEFKFDPVNLNT
jgi:hypothetical protein